jgi:hypothetical protein
MSDHDETPDSLPLTQDASPDFIVDSEAEGKRKLSRGTIVLGGLILAAFAGLGVMHFRTGPATAQASTDAAKTINTFLGDGKKNLVTMRQVLSDTDKLVDDFRNFPAAAQVPLEDLQRNPFSDGSDAAKSTEPVEAFDRKAKLDAAMKRVTGLKVQSIMYSESTRSCMIDNRFRTEGDTFDNFEIERINPASVIVKTDGFRFEVKVKN